MKQELSYLTLMEFMEKEWELNSKEPSLRIHRDIFVATFDEVSFEHINHFLRELDERYHAIRVTDYAYSKKWEEDGFLDLTAHQIAELQRTNLSKKNIDAINQTILTTSIVIEPDFLNVLESFRNSWKLRTLEPSPVESLITAKLRLRGQTLSLEFEGKQIELCHYRSKKDKGYNACKSLLEARGEFVPKHGLTTSILRTTTNQLPKLMRLDLALAKIFYRYNGTHAALSPSVELNKQNAITVRAYVNRKTREKRAT